MRDMRYALRALVRARWFTAGAVATFAIGIGANVAVFSLVDRLLFRPLPYRSPDQLVAIQPVEGGRAYARTPKPLVIGARELRGVFAGLGISGQSAAFFDPAEPDAPPVRLTTATYQVLGVLGVQPAIGRDFTREDAEGKRRLGLLTDEVWRRRFGGDRTAIGRRVGTGASAVEIIGILPAGFTPPSGFWGSGSDGLLLDSDLLEAATPREGVFPPVARLAAGVTVAAAQSAMDGVAARVSKDIARPGEPPLQVRVSPLQTAMFGGLHPTLWLVVAAAALVLLIACANLSSLLVARGRSRELNVALSRALGASPLRLALVAFVECLAVALAGAVVALGAVAVTGGALTALEPAELRQFAVVAPDLRVLALALGAAVACASISGALPVLRLVRVDVLAVLQRGTRTGRRTRSFGARSLIAAEAAFGLLLVAGAILTGRSLIGLLERDLGFVPRDLFVVSASLPFQHPAASKMAMYAEAREVLRQQPGVVSVGGIDTFTVGGSTGMRGFPSRERTREGYLYQIAGDYFETVGQRVIAGRSITDADASHNLLVAVVSERGARVLWPDAAPDAVIGRILQVPSEAPRVVVGVVASQRAQAVTEPVAGAFVPYGAADPKIADRVVAMEIVVRMQPGQSPNIAALRSRLLADFPQVTVRGRDAASLVEPWIQQPKFRAYLFGSFALAGLLLAVIGLYAVASVDVALRRYEMGIRMTLGARPGQVQREIVAASLVPVAAGVGIGLVAAWWASRFLQSLLEDVSAHDPLLIGAAAATLLVSAALAAWAPARRAARTDPAVVLRAQ